MSPETTKRFWNSAERDGECLVWTRSRNRGGYGQFNAEGEIWLAHRLAFFLTSGTRPRCVCHKCDNRPCIEPVHLFGGTYLDNNRDMFGKGRGFKFDGTQMTGERNPNTPLTAADVVRIRALRADGMEYRPIGRLFGISGTTACNIVHRKTWGHVP